ncbi:uncharacterized protein PV06_09232 [Exophiala oligosperma]|uniref:Uncharacterized protein n=1 Tax=Exophiala oligosperma TaxID=215243 RepID=A0A0D2DR68_9EURO|nr:uncharacterized protein PV06_09232 [Exophiala oligosperma]KIW38249.1 hypothetical protein PV06_09232 [Exophiala oligosperma]
MIVSEMGKQLTTTLTGLAGRLKEREADVSAGRGGGGGGGRSRSKPGPVSEDFGLFLHTVFLGRCHSCTRVAVQPSIILPLPQEAFVVLYIGACPNLRGPMIHGFAPRKTSLEPKNDKSDFTLGLLLW